MQEPGCGQFEVFQSVLDPDRLTLLELWADQAALDVHAEATRHGRRSHPDCEQAVERAKTTSTIGSADA